ncbi:TetR/AcrR family transcriptional regulator [Microbacterium foliorum]|uniref:HTH-type transcriptional regulator BetI n=1 Tax=Microbacterium foliorum TaxID=104336 RepID=A0A0F0KJQ6_9MICO|nr:MULTISPECIES: TetR/AcrR family transcriptional regulator [Microbacterium]AXL13169.1 TetR/AcrR family transcriptional regulator [Microbacterium foliorum]KJL21132.1 HTH-type transcriptional regulator BetI [Microbacterium foliorum]
MSSDTSEESTRSQLVRAAVAVISSKGMRGLTLRAAAAQAGLTHGLIVRHFGTRDRLIEEAMEYAIDRSLAGSVPSGLVGTRPQLGDHLVEVGLDDGGAVAFQREVLNEALRNPRLRGLAVKMYERYESAVREQLEGMGVVDPDVVVLVGAAMDGLVRRQMDLRDLASTERAMRALDGIVRGLGVGAQRVD